MTSELAKKECKACDGDALRQFKNQLDGGWHFADEQRLEKTFKFPDFRHALQFTNASAKSTTSKGIIQIFF